MGNQIGNISREAASFPVIGIYHTLPIIQLFYKKATDLLTEKPLLERGFGENGYDNRPDFFLYGLGKEAVPVTGKKSGVGIKGFVSEEQKRNESFLHESNVNM